MRLPDPYMLVIYTVALASLARLITIDPLFERPRDALVSGTVTASNQARTFAKTVADKLDDKPWSIGHTISTLTALAMSAVRFFAWVLGHWMTCPWCIGFWLALLMLWGRSYWDNPVVLFLAVAMAMRQVAGLLADR